MPDVVVAKILTVLFVFRMEFSDLLVSPAFDKSRTHHILTSNGLDFWMCVYVKIDNCEEALSRAV